MTGDFGTPAGAAELADRLAIQDILSCHSRGLDRLDEALLKACYWPEAEVDYGSYKGPAQQFAELVIPALQGNYELTRHCLGNTLVELRGSRALVESSVDASHLLPGAKEEMLFAGRYLDTLEKRGGRWKLLRRQVVMDWNRRQQVADERSSDAFAAMAKGAHGTDDPLHAFLGDTTDEEQANGRPN
jgi:hypothetical protein